MVMKCHAHLSCPGVLHFLQKFGERRADALGLQQGANWAENSCAEVCSSQRPAPRQEKVERENPCVVLSQMKTAQYLSDKENGTRSVTCDLVSFRFVSVASMLYFLFTRAFCPICALLQARCVKFLLFEFLKKVEEFWSNSGGYGVS